MPNSPLSQEASQYMVVAMQLVLYSVFTKLSELDRRIERAILEGFEEAALGAELLSVRGPGEELKAEGAVLFDLIEHMKQQTFPGEGRDPRAQNCPN
jgi:hypothetical protein